MNEFELTFRESVNNLGRRLVVSQKAPKNIHEVLGDEAFSSVLLKRGDASDLSWLVDYKDQINHLQIFGNVSDWGSINKLKSLRVLEIQDEVGADLDFQLLPNLRYMMGNWGAGFEATLGNPSRVEALLIYGFGNRDFSAFTAQTKLRFLKLIGAKKLESLTGVQALTGMELLEFYSSPRLTDISAVSGLRKLDALILDNCKRVHELPPLDDIHVKELLIDSDAIKSLKPLARWPDLESLTFVCQVEDEDIEVVKTFENLKFVIFQNKRNLSTKVKEIAAYFESQGHDQKALRNARRRFEGIAGSSVYRIAKES